MVVVLCSIVDKVDQGIGNLLCIGSHHIAHLAMRNNLGQAPHISHQHGALKVVGNLRDTALCGCLIGLCHEIGSSKVVAYLISRNKLLAPHDVFGQL